MEEQEPLDEPALELHPPEGVEFNCPTCKKPGEFVVIHLEADHGHVFPCSCRIDPDGLQALMDAS